MQRDLGIETETQRQWLHDELVRLWKVRGPFPGLGAVLKAFGLSTRRLRSARVAVSALGETKIRGRRWMRHSVILRFWPRVWRRDLTELLPTWKSLPARRRQYLRLLSRFELHAEQAQHLYEDSSRHKRGWVATDSELLANPYRIYEVSRHDPEGVHQLSIDRGVFPGRRGSPDASLGAAFTSRVCGGRAFASVRSVLLR